MGIKLVFFYQPGRNKKLEVGKSWRKRRKCPSVDSRLCEFKKVLSMNRDEERESKDHKKHQKYKTIYIQFKLIINPLNIKIFTI